MITWLWSRERVQSRGNDRSRKQLWPCLPLRLHTPSLDTPGSVSWTRNLIGSLTVCSDWSWPPIIPRNLQPGSGSGRYDVRVIMHDPKCDQAETCGAFYHFIWRTIGMLLRQQNGGARAFLITIFFLVLFCRRVLVCGKIDCTSILYFSKRNATRWLGSAPPAGKDVKD